MSSTDHIYHLAASRLGDKCDRSLRGDKCDRSMTLGKLLDNNPTFFISILMMTQEPILGTAILGTNQLQPVKWEGVAY